MAEPASDDVPTILDYLYEYIWEAILNYVPVRDIIRTERTSRDWQRVMLTYLKSNSRRIKSYNGFKRVKRLGISSAADYCIGNDNSLLHNGHIRYNHDFLSFRSANVYEDQMQSFESWTEKLGPSVVSAYVSHTLIWGQIMKECQNIEEVSFYSLDELAYNETECEWSPVCPLYPSPAHFGISKWIYRHWCPLHQPCGTNESNDGPQSIRRIRFQGISGSNAGDKLISRFLRNIFIKKSLQELEINECRRMTGQCLIDAQCPNLKSLIINYISDLSFEKLRAADCLGQLTAFKLTNYDRYREMDLDQETSLLVDKMPKLERLVVECNVQTGTGNNRFFKSVSQLRELKVISTDIDMTDEDLEVVTRDPGLQVLRLFGIEDVTNRGVAALCGAGARLTIRWLCLGENRHLTDEDAVSIISSCLNLEVLELDECDEVTSAVLPRAAARRALRVRTPLHLIGDFDANEEFEELVYHRGYSDKLKCGKCARYDTFQLV